MKIEDILTPEEIQIVKDHVKVDAPYNKVRQLFLKLDKHQASVFFEFYKKCKECDQTELGYKDAPYYTTEDIDEIYPQYSWKDLPHDEKAWYNIRKKNKRK